MAYNFMFALLTPFKETGVIIYVIMSPDLDISMIIQSLLIDDIQVANKVYIGMIEHGAECI